MNPDVNGPRLLASLLTTLGAWLVAFGVLTALLSLFGDELGALPLALRALVISGVLVPLIVNLVVPVVRLAVARWLAVPPRTRLRRAWLRAGRERERRERPQDT